MITTQVSQAILLFLGVGFFSILLHELGHWLFMKTPRMQFSITLTGRGKEHWLMYVWGIMMGLIPIIWVAVMISYLYFLLLIVYIIGCSYDIKKIWGLNK
jgi:hypothetical protein